MRYIFSFFSILFFFSFSGCASHGMKTANHNGVMYYFPPNCEQYSYSYSNPNILYCLHNGKRTGRVLQPASQQQINNNRYEREQTQKGWDNLNKTVRDINPQKNNVYHYY